MGETEISWTHKPGTVGRTWNPVQGCRRISPGCEHCYAERLAARFAESGWSQGLINLKTRKWNGNARLAAHKLGEPLRWRQPSTVFVNSMSDLFYDGFTNEQIAAVFGVMAACPQHTFQVLTKRATRMREWFEWVAAESRRGMLTSISNPACVALTLAADHVGEGVLVGRASTPWPLPNVWLGVSVENQEAADERIPELLRTPAAVRFLSCEPLIGPVDLTDRIGVWSHCPDCGRDVKLDEDGCCRSCGMDAYRYGVDWVIAGCESGPGARECKVEWLRSLRDQCAAAGVPFFLKQATHVDSDIIQSPDAEYHQMTSGAGSKRKAGGVIELPYLDGVQHCSFPEAK